jgi:predicted metal-binding membrane protein
VLSTPHITALSRRDRTLIATCVVLLTVLAWVYLFYLDRQMSSLMEHETMMKEMGMTMDMPWTIVDMLVTFAMWTVMMVGMMMPAVTPVLLLYAAARTSREQPGGSLAVLLFSLGYLTIWTCFSAGATLAQWGLHQTAMLSPAMAASSAYLAGAILISAGIYQLSPWKGACLVHCRSPLGFLMANWRDGNRGAFQMGFRHGMYCLGCCWALMCLLFVVGVMNLVWVAAITVFVLLEKIGPAGALVARVAGVVMIAAGVLSIVTKIFV